MNRKVSPINHWDLNWSGEVVEKIDSYAEIIDVLSDTATKMKHTAAVLEQVRRTHAEAIHLIDTTVAPAI